MKELVFLCFRLFGLVLHVFLVDCSGELWGGKFKPILALLASPSLLYPGVVKLTACVWAQGKQSPLECGLAVYHNGSHLAGLRPVTAMVKCGLRFLFSPWVPESILSQSSWWWLRKDHSLKKFICLLAKTPSRWSPVEVCTNTDGCQE